MRRILVLCAAVLTCGITRAESPDDFPPDQVLPAGEAGLQADSYKVRVEGGSVQELDHRAWQLMMGFCKKTVKKSVVVEVGALGPHDSTLAYTFRCGAGPQDVAHYPNGEILEDGPGIYKIHVADGPMDYVEKEASQLMKEFCKKTNRTVAVTDGAYDGGVGLRYTFTCVAPPQHTN